MSWAPLRTYSEHLMRTPHCPRINIFTLGASLTWARHVDSLTKDTPIRERAMEAHSEDKLARLSLYAAQEADRQLSGAEPRAHVLRDWAEQLSNISGAHGGPDVAFLHSDPDTTDAIANAIDKTSTDRVESTRDLARAMDRIIQPLLEKQTIQEDTLRLVKLFSIALHKSLLALRAPARVNSEFTYDELNHG